jgi:formylglycine-generating enzyme required for sulfatase activity
MPHQVFLSHSGADAKKAEKLCLALEAEGITCWIAPRDIPGGASYSGEIVRAIAESRLLVLLYSSDAAQSRHVRSELEVAFNDGDSILAVRLQDHEMPTDLQYFLSTGQWIDAFKNDFDLELDHIVKSIQAAVAGAALPHAVEPSRRRMNVTYIAALLLGIAGIAMWLRPGASTREAPPAAAGEVRVAQPPKTTPNALSGPSKEMINIKDQQRYVLIPAGRYLMGCSGADSECEDDEKPARWVSIAKPFWLGQTEVTVGAFSEFAKTLGRKVPTPANQLPVTEVDRADAVAYCRWAGGTLPSEAEWEYAARGGVSEPRYGPLLEIAWIDRNSGEMPHPVGQKQANAYGLQDMLGNAAEWVLDRYYQKYDEEDAGSPPVEPIAGNATAIVRGGSWASGASSARASNRAEMEKDAMEPFVGFRCALQAKQ